VEDFKEFKPLPKARWSEKKEDGELKWSHQFFHRIYIRYLDYGISPLAWF